MRACVQRVLEAHVTVASDEVGRIASGLVVLLGVATKDTAEDARQLAAKIISLRIFEDDEGKMNRTLIEVGGALLAVSQFTLLGDCRKGRRPSFTSAAEPSVAERLYEMFVEEVRAAGVETAMGIFGAHMQVALVNDGPVTLLLDSGRKF